MILSLMGYAVLVSTVLALVGAGVEALLRWLGQQARFTWLVCMGGVVVLLAVGVARAVSPAPAVAFDEAVAAQPEMMGAAAVTSRSGVWPRVKESMEAVGSSVEFPLWAMGAISRGPADAILGWFWVGSSAAFLCLGLAALAGYRARRVRWPMDEVEGRRVRVSPGTGPVVMGVVRPEIVVPEWLLRTAPRVKRMVMLHEEQHVSGRDPAVLAAGWVLAGLVAWNPVMHWMLRRLRVAVEVDCDARVLGGDVSPGEYGLMLIDVSGRLSGVAGRLPALGGCRTTLERRIMMMTMTRRRGWRTPVRAGGLGLVGTVGLLAACEARIPSAAEIDGLTVAAVESGVREFGVDWMSADRLTYYRDGVEIAAGEARSVGAEEIAAVTVRRDGETGRMEIETRRGGARVQVAQPGGMPIRHPTDAPLILLHDRVISAADLGRIDPQLVERIEVFKGEGATAAYSEPQAANGVIRIRLKTAGSAE